MAQLLHTYETIEEQELRRRQAKAKRIRYLVIATAAVVALRFFIKDPPPPPPQDMAKATIRYSPGMLDKMSASSLKKMDPVLLARLQKADADAKMAQMKASKSFVTGAYKPADEPVKNIAEEEQNKQIEFAYAKRRHKIQETHKKMEAQDITKPMLVQFKTGGHIRVEAADKQKQGCEIRLDRSMIARLPNNMVKSISDNARDWEEPVPKGFVRLKPANGITITVQKETSKRITVKRRVSDES